MIPLLIVFANKIAKKKLGKYWGKYTDLGDTFLDNIQGLTVLKTYNADEKVHNHINVKAEDFRKMTMKVLTMQLNSVSIMDLVAYGGAAAAIALSLIYVNNGSLNPFYALFAILLSAEFFLPMRTLGSAFHIAMNGMAANNKIIKILDTEEATVKSAVISQEKICIEVSNLSFSYIEEKTALKDVSFSLREKGLIAVVGESGSGKSTITKLLMGYYDDYDGSIIMNGKDVKTLNFANINKRISVISQESYIFGGTIKDNLLMANPKASDEELYQALKFANLASFVDNKQEGLYFKLDERGSNISGGERQRLALARAYLKDSDLYIFDEPTSNIDKESESQIINLIYKLSKTKSVLFITHRLANVFAADKIIVMDKGKIVEQGKNDELIKNKAYYYRLFEAQQRLEKNFRREQDGEEKNSVSVYKAV